jgi:hypothetical protein
MSGIFKSVADLFRPTQAVTQQQAIYVQPAPTPAPTPAPNVLDTVATLWQTDDKSKAPVDPFAAPLLQTDPAKLQQAASKIDFTSQIAPDLMAKAMSGQDPAAFMEVLNTVARTTLTTSAQLSAATVEQATARNNERMMQALPATVTQIQLDSIRPESAVLQHAAAEPFLKLVRSQLQMKNPHMSAHEINRQAESTVLNFAKEVSAAPAPGAAPTQASTETDWDAWVSK